MANRGKSYSEDVHSIKDLERAGSEKLPRIYREFYNEGAMDLITLRQNEAAYDRYWIRPRVLRDTTGLDTTATVFDARVRFPFGFSPSAWHGLAHPDGEIATSKAAANTDIPMVLSMWSSKPLEEVIGAGKGNPYVMQLSLLKNKKAMVQAIERAERAGFRALLITLDSPCLGRRLNEQRNKFALPPDMGLPNIFPDGSIPDLEEGDEFLAYDSGIEWAEMVTFFRKHTEMQIWGKGIYTAQDALLAIKHGLDGIIVSNHGGRQLDGVPATLDVLREVAGVVHGRIPIGIDGGIRRGTDIFKALAVGADFCLAGRPALWGLAYDGERGVEMAINILYDEFKTCMALAGCKNISDITSECLSLLTDGVLSKL